MRILQGHTDYVTHVVALPGERALSASGDKTLRLWDLASGQTLHVLEGHLGREDTTLRGAFRLFDFAQQGRDGLRQPPHRARGDRHERAAHRDRARHRHQPARPHSAIGRIAGDLDGPARSYARRPGATSARFCQGLAKTQAGHARRLDDLVGQRAHFGRICSRSFWMAAARATSSSNNSLARRAARRPVLARA